MKRTLPLFAALLTLAGSASAQSPGYHVIARDSLGGEGGWDYLSLDTASHRIFITRGDRVMAIDPAASKVVGEIPGLQRAHGVAFDYAVGRGFATSGGDSTVVIFDLKTLQRTGTAPASDDADAILFDPATHRIFTFNGDANSSTVIDGKSGKRIGTIPLGGKPEFGVSDGKGRLYANLEDKNEIVEIDPSAMKVLRRWPLTGCEGPTGLAIDVAHARLFSGCRGTKTMTISDAKAGQVVASAPIGSGVDATRFDPGTQLAFASTGDGSITVIREITPDSFAVVQTIETMPGARTMELDPVSHRLYTASAKFGPMPDSAASGGRRRRPPMVPGSFTLLVMGR